MVRMKRIAIFLLIGFPLFSQSKETPNFAIYDVDGNRQIFYQLLEKLPKDGKVILNFTSVHCKPCEKEIPELIEIEKTNSKVKLYCIFAEASDLAKPKGKSLGLTTVYSDPVENIQGLLGIKEYPTTVVFNGAGKRLGTFIGYNEKQMKALKKLVGD